MTTEKKKRTLGEYFSRYKPVSQVQRELFALAEDIRIRAAQEAKMVEVNFTLPKLFRKSVLYETEAALTEFYSQNSVRLFPHYPAELFSLKYMDEVLCEAKRIGSVVNGFFDRYEIVEDGDTIEIHIPFLQGGIDLLDFAKTGEILRGIIRSEFGIDRPVKIVQAANYAEHYKDYEAARDAWLREEAAQIPARQAAAAARAAEEAEAAKAEEVPADTPAEESTGSTVVEVSKLMRPGTALSGTVKFASGSTADWYIDQTGRLGLENLVGEKPTQEDIQQFQVELEKAVYGGR